MLPYRLLEDRWMRFKVKLAKRLFPHLTDAMLTDNVGVRITGASVTKSDTNWYLDKDNFHDKLGDKVLILGPRHLNIKLIEYFGVDLDRVADLESMTESGITPPTNYSEYSVMLSNIVGSGLSKETRRGLYCMADTVISQRGEVYMVGKCNRGIPTSTVIAEIRLGVKSFE